jgi:hypothetical protein
LINPFLIYRSYHTDHKQIDSLIDSLIDWLIVLYTFV